MAKIVILGGGFAALTAVEVLTKAIGEDDEISLVSVNSEFIFSPALVPMVFGDFKPDDIHFNIRPLLMEHGVKFVQGGVVGIDPMARTVRVVNDWIEEIVDYDYLLVALGRSLLVQEVPGFTEHANHLLTPAAAMKLRKAIADFDTGSIVVGLCPDGLLPIPVCETALGLARKFERKIASGDVTVKAVFPSTLENALAGSALFRDLDSEFERKGIELIADFPIARVEEKAILSSFGTTIEHDLLMLVPPFEGHTQQRHLGPLADETGYLPVNELMQVKGFDGVYAAGDIAALGGPKFGYMAIRQAKVAADNIIAELRGDKPCSEYVHSVSWVLNEKYTDPVFFHYGFWDETLADFDERAFFGMARQLRERYGRIKAGEANIASPA
jgi:sulfide:quinone oxidoreductase